MAKQHTLNLPDRFAAPNGKQEAPKKPRKTPRVPTRKEKIIIARKIEERAAAGTLIGTRQQIADEIGAELDPPRSLAPSTITGYMKDLGLTSTRPARKSSAPRLDDCETTIANLSVVICDLCRVMVAGSMVGSLPASIVNFANLELEFANLELDK